MSNELEIPEYKDPIVRGEHVVVLGKKPAGFTGLGHLNGNILVLYPDGEEGCVKASEISEGAKS